MTAIINSPFFQAFSINTTTPTIVTGDTYLFSNGVEKIMFHPENTSAITTVKAPNETMTLFVARDGSYLSVNGWKGDKAQPNTSLRGAFPSKKNSVQRHNVIKLIKK